MHIVGRKGQKQRIYQQKVGIEPVQNRQVFGNVNFEEVETVKATAAAK